MEKSLFVSPDQLEAICAHYPTPFHLYDEQGIRDNIRALLAAFAWNEGFKEYFAVKATPNPFLLKILRAEGLGVGWVSILDAPSLCAAWKTPKDWTLVAYLCIGWPRDDDTAPELERLGWEERRAMPPLEML